MNYKDILGSLSEDEANLLRECAKQAPLNRFLEIGTFLGRSASVIGEVAKEQGGTLFCVDYFLKNMKYWGTPSSTIADTKADFLRNMGECGLSETIITIEGNSTSFLDKLNGKFGFVYIDGGHTVSSCLPDALRTWNKIKEGGFLCFHDYNNKKWEDIKIIVDVLMKKWEVEPYKISESKNLIAIKKCLP